MCHVCLSSSLDSCQLMHHVLCVLFPMNDGHRHALWLWRRYRGDGGGCIITSLSSYYVLADCLLLGHYLSFVGSTMTLVRWRWLPFPWFWCTRNRVLCASNITSECVGMRKPSLDTSLPPLRCMLLQLWHRLQRSWPCRGMGSR